LRCFGFLLLIIAAPSSNLSARTPRGNSLNQPKNSSNVISVKDHGANGDCADPHDDTLALIAAAAAVNTAPKPATLYFEKGCYYMNPLKAVRAGSLEWYGLDISADNVTITGPGVLGLLPGHDYSAELRVPSGTTAYWFFFRCRASHFKLDSLTVSNGPNLTKTGPYTSGPGNFWACGVKATKRIDGNYGKKNSVVNCKFLNLGGWAALFEYQENAILTNNYATQSEGIGFGAAVLYGQIVHNMSKRALDAHYFANGAVVNGVHLPNEHILIESNIADGNSNGSGIDVTDSAFVTVSNNLVRNNQNWCILIDKTNGPFKSAATDQPAVHVTLTGNRCVNNGNYQGWNDNSEIAVGDVNPSLKPGRAAQWINVSKNIITTQNNQGIGVETAWGVSHVRISGNQISGCGSHTDPCAYPASDVIRVMDRNGEYISIIGNRQDSKYTGKIYLGGSGPYQLLRNNMGLLRK